MLDIAIHLNPNVALYYRNKGITKNLKIIRRCTIFIEIL